MFYGNFSPEDHELLRRVVERFPQIFGRLHMADNNILVGKTLSFLEEPRFQAALERQAGNDQERSLAVRFNTLVWAFDNATKLDGDIVECGVWRGASFAFLADYFDLGTINKTLWLYDTWAGIPAEYDTEGHNSPDLSEAGLFEAVTRRFGAYPNVRLVRGVLPASLEGSSPEAIALLHLDLNSTPAEIGTLDALFDRIVPGGMIVFDDYGWAGYSAQHYAEKAWAEARGYRILELVNGQGLLVKR